MRIFQEKITTLALYIVTLALLTSCSVKNDCNNQFEFVSCNIDSIPILNLDITKHPDTIRKEMNKLYNSDLCKNCSLVDFRLPFTIDNQKGYLKIMTDFDFPVCENCPIPIRRRNNFSIMINSRNQLSAGGKLIPLDSLQSEINRYLSTVGIDKMGPENFGQVNFRMFWDQSSSIEFLDSVLISLYSSHLSFVLAELEKEGIDFCKLEKTTIKQLKEKYPLRIEFDLGKIEKNSPKR